MKERQENLTTNQGVPVTNNLPEFFIRDAMKFPDMVHGFKASPDSNVPDDARFWDFISLTPEPTDKLAG